MHSQLSLSLSLSQSLNVLEGRKATYFQHKKQTIGRQVVIELKSFYEGFISINVIIMYMIMYRAHSVLAISKSQCLGQFSDSFAFSALWFRFNFNIASQEIDQWWSWTRVFTASKTTNMINKVYCGSFILLCENLSPVSLTIILIIV